MQELRPEMDKLMQGDQGFQNEFAKARQAFDESFKAKGTYPSHQDWEAFNQGQQAKIHQHFVELRDKQIALMKSKLGDCFDARMVPPMPPEGGGPPPGMPPGGQPDDGRFQDFDNAEKMRRQCQFGPGGPPGGAPASGDAGRTKQVSPSAAPPSAATAPSAAEPRRAPPPPEVMRVCEKQMHDQYQENHRDDKSDKFKDQFGSFSMAFDAGRVKVVGKHLSMTGDQESQMITDVTCHGSVFIHRLFANGYFANFQPSQGEEGTFIAISDSANETVLSIHDSPRCVINVAATAQIPSIGLELAEYLDCKKNAAGDVACSDGNGADAVVLLHGGDAVMGGTNELKITGKATFIVSSSDASNSKLGSSYEKAIKNKKVGAEVKIAAGESGKLAVDDVPMGDLQVKISGKKDKVVALVDSEQGEAKVVALELDQDLFSNGNLQAAVEDVESGENLKSTEAKDLDAVLDLSCKGTEAATYWVVQDKNGYHVLVCVPHFSEKKITIQSIAGTTMPFGSLNLILLGLAGAALVGGGVYVIRKRKASGSPPANANEMYTLALRASLKNGELSKDSELHMADLAQKLGIGAGDAMRLRAEVEGETQATTSAAVETKSE